VPRPESGEPSVRLKWAVGQSSDSVQLIKIEDIHVL